jgi:crotonobetainyl-CoA:carnitine CoA-transferase CaiB-like acyl-CoA transferase
MNADDQSRTTRHDDAGAQRLDLLQGIRILDMTGVLMGPYATQTLADLGAEVVMVEPVSGGAVRSMGPGPDPEFSGIALNLLRNKRSIAIDMSKPAGRAAILRVAATCDAVITNLREESLRRLGLAYDDVAAVRPDVVWCEAHGYLASGDDAGKPAYDDVIQAESGVADVVRAWKGSFGLFPSTIADKICGLTIVYSVIAGVVKRDRTGASVRVELPMREAMRSFMLVEHGAGAIPQPPVGPAGYRRVLAASRGPFKTADGWLSVLPYTPKDWRTVFGLAGRADLADDPRITSQALAIENAADLYAELGIVLADRTTEEWVRLLDSAGLASGRVITLSEVVDDMEEVQHPVVGGYKSIGLPIVSEPDTLQPFLPAPEIGQHSLDILQECGRHREKSSP